MEKVCDEIDGKSTWQYEAGMYFRHYPDGNIAKIKGEYLPDPEMLWQSRCAALKVTKSSHQGLLAKPTKTTFFLWNHWQGIKNADAHNQL